MREVGAAGRFFDRHVLRGVDTQTLLVPVLVCLR
jgi:hypothetical protein